MGGLWHTTANPRNPQIPNRPTPQSQPKPDQPEATIQITNGCGQVNLTLTMINEMTIHMSSRTKKGPLQDANLPPEYDDALHTDAHTLSANSRAIGQCIATQGHLLQAAWTVTVSRHNTF